MIDRIKMLVKFFNSKEKFYFSIFFNINDNTFVDCNGKKHYFFDMNIIFNSKKQNIKSRKKFYIQVNKNGKLTYEEFDD